MEYRSIELNVKIGCPIMCSYCPQDVLLSSNYGDSKFLTENNLKLILDNATYKNNKIEVFFAAFTEPLSVKNWLELVNICENHKLVSKIVIFTTGYKITEEQIISLSKLKKVKINFHVGKNVTMKNFDNELWSKLEIISKFIPQSTFLGVGFDENYFFDISKLLSKNNLKFVFQKIISRSGNVSKVNEVELDYNLTKHIVTCEKMNIKKRPVILPDGTALACANDYGCELKLGNLLNEVWDKLNFEKIINIQKNIESGAPCFRDCHCAKKETKFKIF